MNMRTRVTARLTTRVLAIGALTVGGCAIGAVTAMTTVALLTGPAVAQEEQKAPLTRRSEAQQREDAEIDKAYRRATKGEAEPPVKLDPWRKVRPADDDRKNNH